MWILPLLFFFELKKEVELWDSAYSPLILLRFYVPLVVERAGTCGTLAGADAPVQSSGAPPSNRARIAFSICARAGRT